MLHSPASSQWKMSCNMCVFILALLCYVNQVSLVWCHKQVRCEVRTRIDTGWICGKRRLADDGQEYASFRGIPYAKQPLGRLRFEELRPATPWNHYLETTEEGPICPQHDDVYGRLMKPLQGMSEACIYANVHVPLKNTFTDDTLEELNVKVDEEKIQSKGVPILVYIHGGGFQAGSGDSDLNGPEYLVSRGVIVITFNYRINVFGFLYLNTPKIPGNQGLRDQVTLLRWVQRNARAFGGDPDNVTVMGQSGGATLAHILSLSRETDGLFKRLILLSGTANPGYYTTSPLYSKFIATLFLSQLGINSTDPDEIHDQLVNMPLNRILLANSEIQYPTGFISFSPVVETSFPGVTRILDDDPTELIKRGRGNQYPIMIGFTTAECEFFRSKVIYLDLLSRIKANPTLILSPRIVFRTPPNVSQQLAKQTIRRYSKGRLTIDGYLKSCTETFFEYPAFQLANLRASSEGAPVFLYQFSYDNKLNFVKIASWEEFEGPGHIEDFVNIFKPNAIIEEIGKDQIPFRDEQMKDWMTKFVVNFMRCSEPTCSSTRARQSPWPAVQEEAFNYQSIDKPLMYNNSLPTPDQWDMIQFYEYLEAESRRAVAEQGLLTDGTPLADAFMANLTSEPVLKRPDYPIAIIYRPKPPKMYIKELH